MSSPAEHRARARVLELAADPRYRPFVVGYLLSCLDERHWMALVDAAIDFGETNARLQAEAAERGRGLASERG